VIGRVAGRIKRSDFAQHRIEVLAHLFRIELLDETRRTADIREQDRDALALAFQITA